MFLDQHIERHKRRIAIWVRRAPWSIRILLTLWRRLRQPWITVGTIGAVFNDAGQVLIVEHVFHPVVPWGLPGGWMNRHETPDQTIIRELHEETALDVIVEQPLLIAGASVLRDHLDIAYLCRAVPGPITLSGELLDYRWADPYDPPPLLSFHRHVIAAALEVRAHLPHSDSSAPGSEPEAGNGINTHFQEFSDR